MHTICIPIRGAKSCLVFTILNKRQPIILKAGRLGAGALVLKLDKKRDCAKKSNKYESYVFT